MPRCCDCGQVRGKKDFSKSQWKKPQDKKRCVDCAFDVEQQASEGKERPSCWICLCDDQTRVNPIVRECGCRGTAGNVHIECLIGLAKSKSSQLSLEMEKNKDLIIGSQGDAPNPWEECTTCRQPFLKTSKSAVALAEAALLTYPSSESNYRWHLAALQANASVKDHAGDQIGARNFMDAQITLMKEHPRFALLGPEPFALSNALCNKAVTHMTEEECDDMVPLLDEASEYARKLGESKEASLLFAQISNLRAHHSGFKRKNDDAIEYIGESIDIYRQHLPGSAELSNQLWKSGNLKYCVGDTKMGLREQTESLIILERLRGGNDRLVILRKNELQSKKKQLAPLATGNLLQAVGGYISPETAKLGAKVEIIEFNSNMEGMSAYAVKKSDGRVSWVPVHEVRLDPGSHVVMLNGIPPLYGIKCGSIIRYDRNARAYCVDAGQFEIQCASSQCIVAKPSKACCLE